ncbi:hypothetical protein TSAR_011427, partial [Trichomalopsis sarcophagae]
VYKVVELGFIRCSSEVTGPLEKIGIFGAVVAGVLMMIIDAHRSLGHRLYVPGEYLESTLSKIYGESSRLITTPLALEATMYLELLKLLKSNKSRAAA